MRNTKTLATAALILGALLASCGQQFYRSRPNDPPLLAEKGDAQVGAQLQIGATGTTGISGAWSPAKHLGLQAGHSGSGSTGIITVGNDLYHYQERRNQTYLGVGYYTAPTATKLFEVYGGVGAAGFSSLNTGYVHRMRLTNWYLQPAFAVRLPHVELAASLRYDYLRRGLTELDTSYQRASLHRFLDFRNYGFLQPGLTLRAGGRLRFTFEFFESFVLNRSYETIYGSSSQHGVAQYAVGLQWKPGRRMRAR
ncbi:hypothetical protein [Flaviaesturariibacter terrae]